MRNKDIKAIAQGTVDCLNAGASMKQIKRVLRDVCLSCPVCTMDETTCALNLISKKAVKISRRREV